jgi:ABC-type multidrug transport system ATPase subunit
MSEDRLNTVTALVGLKALERAMAEAAPETEFCSGVDIPFYPRLSVRSNARAVRMALPEEDRELFWELLKVSGLRASGWNVSHLQEQPGPLRLWGLVLGLVKHAPAMLALEPMSGMDAHDRAHFAELLRWCGEKGVPFIYTAAQLKDVMELDFPHKLRLAAPEGWLETDTARMEEALERSEDKSWNKIQQGWEGEQA